MKFFIKCTALAILAMGVFSSCNKDNVPADKAKGNQTVLVKLDLPKLKAGVPEGVAKEFADDLPQITSVNIYLLQPDGKIAQVKSIEKSNTSEWNKLVDPTPNTTTGGGGVKFTNVPSDVNRVIVEANVPTPLTASTMWADRTIATTLNGNVYMVGEDKALKDLGKEPIQPTVGGESPTTTVKQANVTIKPIASRFQIVGLKLYDKASNGDLTESTTAKVIGVVFNRFSEKATVAAADLTVTTPANKRYSSSAEGFINKSLFFAGTSAESYKLPLDDQGTVNDVSDIASYIWNKGTSTAIKINAAETDKAKTKVIAFNFFPQGIVSTSIDPKSTVNTNPKIHIIVDMKGDGTDIRFINIAAFTKGGAAVTFEPGKLYSLNLSNEDEGAPAAGNAGGGGAGSAEKTPVIVKSDKAGEPADVTPDISTKEVNLIARVTVAKWTAENLKPVFDK